MLKRFQTYIEQEPWDEVIKRQQRWLDRASWLIIILAVIYFSPFILHIFTR